MSALIFDKSVKGRTGSRVPQLSPEEARVEFPLPDSLCASEPPALPEVSELDVVRHYTLLSHKNYSVDTHFYPLGSCTMKYNPRLCEKVASLDGFTELHPMLPELRDGALAQGGLEALWRLEKLLCELTGMAAFSMQPLAGAHGELAGMLMIAAWHRTRGEQRSKVLIPDSAHGTNPASAAMAGFRIESLATNAEGCVDMDDLRARLTPDVAAIMLTCPNTLGIFERDILEISRLARANDTLLYYDGANLNALMGVARPGDLGFDIVHLNIHKTLSTPHGGGGPGGGPVGCSSDLEPFLPKPVVARKDSGLFYLEHNRPRSIGRVAPFYGNFAVSLRAYAYLLLLGGDGVRRVAEHAVLNANYVRARLRETYDLPYKGVCMHEVVLSAKRQLRESGVRAMDIAKALIDAGFHPPTVYFPLIVPEAMMIEPTESESKETLDRFVEAMIKIAALAERQPGSFATMPLTTGVSRPDETRAARTMKLKA